MHEVPYIYFWSLPSKHKLQISLWPSVLYMYLFGSYSEFNCESSTIHACLTVLYCTVFAEHILALLLLPFLSSIASNALRNIFSHKQHNCRIASIRLEYCSVEYQNSPSTTDFAQRNSCDTDSTRLDTTQTQLKFLKFCFCSHLYQLSSYNVLQSDLPFVSFSLFGWGSSSSSFYAYSFESIKLSNDCTQWFHDLLHDSCLCKCSHQQCFYLFRSFSYTNIFILHFNKNFPLNLFEKQIKNSNRFTVVL